MQSEQQQVRTGIVPVRALPNLFKNADKGDDDAIAVTNLVAHWWHLARIKMDRPSPSDIVGCAGCDATLNENKVGGFAVLIPVRGGSKPMPAHCAAFCFDCMSRPYKELHAAFAKALEFDGKRRA
jgi:hypothetical protein